MEQLQQELNEINAKINESLPADNDLKGFQGISKALIIDSLINSLTMLTTLKEYESSFEIIFLKRQLSDLFKKIKKDLEESFDKIKAGEFNTFLNNIARIRFLIKEAYIAVTSAQPIRTETEIAKAKEDLNILTTTIDELKKVKDELPKLKDDTTQNITNALGEIKTLKDAATKSITDIQSGISELNETTVKNIDNVNTEINVLKDSAKLIVTDFETKQANSIENEKKINELIKIFETNKTNIEAVNKNVTLWEVEIKKAQEDIIVKSQTYEDLNTKLMGLKSEIDNAYEKIVGKEDVTGKPVNGYLQKIQNLQDKVEQFSSDQTQKYNTLFNQIESLLPGSTSVGLAKAYEIQKESYKWPIRIWSGVFIFTITLMTSLSIWLIYKQIQNPTITDLPQAFISLLKDLPFFIPTIWLAVFASKQQSKFTRMKEEYAFKETNAKSFHGHKKQIEELMKEGVTDKDLMLQLVAQLVIITSQNPSATLDNKSHEDSPPIFKLVEKLFPSLKRVRDKPKEESKEVK